MYIYIRLQFPEVSILKFVHVCPSWLMHRSAFITLAAVIIMVITPHWSQSWIASCPSIQHTLTMLRRKIWSMCHGVSRDRVRNGCYKWYFHRIKFWRRVWYWVKSRFWRILKTQYVNLVDQRLERGTSFPTFRFSEIQRRKVIQWP